MTAHKHTQKGDSAPGEGGSLATSIPRAILGYGVGLVLATALTLAAFWAVHTHLVYGPGIPFALVALALAQMGVHLVFFLHITTDPDNTNNVLALAFGILIACLLIFGSLWIMNHLNHAMMPMDKLMQMQH